MSDLDTLYDRNESFARTFDQGDLPILSRRPTPWRHFPCFPLLKSTWTATYT